jgi:hypothetical protein
MGKLGRRIVCLGALGCISLWDVSASAQSLSACSQTINYKLTIPGADVPAATRAFSGVWAGTWGNQLCHVLIVEQIAPDGAVKARYVHGTNPGWGINQPGSRQWSGKIAGNTLTLSDKGGSVEYKLVDAGTLSGTYSFGTGRSSGTFKKP